MPFLDFNAEVPAEPLARAEIVVVGAGAAGILLAARLGGAGRRVLLVESGHFAADDDRQALNALVETGQPFGNAIWHRKRILGGTTTAWGGQSLPFSPLDFEPRDWVAQSGWPLRHADLVPWYRAANAFMGIDEWDYAGDLFQRLRCPGPGFDPQVIDYHFSKWAPEPNFLKRHRRKLESCVTVLYNAHLTRIDLDGEGRAQGIELANFRGDRRALPARTLVLATGGIEANRTLLLNRHHHARGLGNHSGWLGRGFMEHPCVDAGRVIPASPRAFQAHFSTHFHRLRRYSVRLSASPAWQRRHRLLNISASLLFIYARMDDDPFAVARRYLRRTADDTTARLRTSHVKALAAGVTALVAHGFLYKPAAAARLTLMLEQEPSEHSYIRLAGKEDRFGRPQAELHWQISDLSWKTAVAFTASLIREFDRLHLGRVELAPPFISPADGRPPLSYFADVNHHMGGTRMSATAGGGVVTPDLQVWNVPGLYVCAGSVFPTGSHSNPTLTLLALAARLADHLHRAA